MAINAMFCKSKLVSIVGKAHSCPGLNETMVRFEPPRGKTNNVVSEQVQHKPDCIVTEDI